MIISTFKTGKGKSRGPLNYLLGNDKDNQPRNPAPVILKGDRKLTEVLIDSNHRQYKYTSGAIAFRDNEKPTPEQLEKIIGAFEKTFTPGLEERVPLFWVKHEDKGNTELHFICPMQDSKTGKQFNICPPGEQFKQMFKDFQALANDNYGWEQVRPNLFKSEMTKVEALTENNVKKVLSKELDRRVKTGELKNRNDFISLVKKFGFEITRIGKDYLGIKHHKAKKATRLKGPAFAENANYQDLLNQSSKPVRLEEEERQEIKKRLARALKNRKKSLQAQFNLEDDDPPPPQTLTRRKDHEDYKFAINQELIKKREQQQATPDLPQSSKPKGFKL